MLHPIGSFPLLFQFREGQGLLHSGFPTGEGVGEEDAGAFVVVIGQWGVQFLHGEADLQVRDHEGGGHYLEAEDPMRGGLLHPRTGESTQAPALQVCCDATQHFGQVRAGTAAGVEDVHVLAGQPVGDAQVVLQGLVHGATM